MSVRLLHNLGVVSLHQWIRFALPGALFELTLLSIVVADSAVCACYPAAPEVDAGVVAILVGASLPLGFLCSVLMNHLLWLDVGSTIFRQYDDLQLLRIAGTVEPDVNLTKEQVQGQLDAILHLRLGETRRGAALARARSIIDLANGLAISSVAVVLGLVSAVLYLTAKFLTAGHVPDVSHGDRWMVIIVGALVACVVATLLRTSQRRVSRILESYLTTVLES